MSITRHRRFKHVLSGVALSTLMAGFVALTTAPANAADGPRLIEAPNLDNTTHMVDQWDKIPFGGFQKIALDNPAFSMDNVPLITYKRNDGTNQLWHFIRQNDGSYEIKNVHSGKCVTAVAHWVYQTDCVKGPRQSWTIKQLITSPTFKPNMHQFVNVGTGMALSRFATGNPPQPPTNELDGVKAVQSIPDINNKYQFWRIEN